MNPLSEEDIIQAVKRIQAYVAEIQEWIGMNKLKFNAAKSEIIMMCAPNIKNKLSMPHIGLGNTVVPISTVAKNIDGFFDDALSMINDVQQSCVVCFHLHCIGRIRNLLDRKTTKMMVHTYVTSRLDNGHCLLVKNHHLDFNI